ncbi:MAG: DNA methyltransferase, partial [Bdellovibrionota bacterium]
LFQYGNDLLFRVPLASHRESSAGGCTTADSTLRLSELQGAGQWGRGLDSYLHWIYETVILLRELLTENGSIYVHVGLQVSDYVRTIMDEVFDRSRWRNTITWQRMYAHNDPKRYGAVSETILFYTKGEKWIWHPQFSEYSEQYLKMYSQLDKDGRRFKVENTLGPGNRGVLYDWKGHKRYWRYSKENMQKLHDAGLLYYTSSGFPKKKVYLDEMPGKPAQDIWTDINVIAGQAKELTGYPTQKPEALLERIIKSSSNEGDLVLDCFCGSGTTAAVAEKLGRRWISCDLGRFAIHTARKRLLSIEKIKPFVVQNLGKYERQVWQAAEFESSDDLRVREARYRKFILDLYHATPVSGYAWIHGTRSSRMVHVGAVDAPVTLSDVKAIAAEVWRAVGTGKGAPQTAGVDILGWEFAFELNELAKQVAAEAHVDVTFKKIPREVLEKKAVEQGDIKFFELAALGVSVKQKGRSVTLKLTDFVILPDDVPQEAQKAIKHWSQWIDYWAVDWDYKDDTFHNQWQSYRTRKEPDLQKEAEYTYEKPGKYTIVVKVIDILGNDTTKTVQIEIK